MSLRKFLLSLVLLLFTTVSEGAVFTLVTHAPMLSDSSGTATNLGGIDTTGANFITIAAVYLISQPTPVVTDNKSNSTYVARTTHLSNAEQALIVFYCYNCTVGTNHVFIVSSAGSFIAGAVASWNNAVITPYDSENFTVNNTASISSISTNTVTPAQTNELLFAAVAPNNSIASMAVDNGYTLLDTVAFSSGQNYALATAYKIQPLTTTTSTTFSWASPDVIGAIASITSFKSTSSALPSSGTCGNFLLLQVGC